MQQLNLIVFIAFAITNVTAFSLSMAASPKRVAVFGGTGFVGSAVCERLVKKGYDVTAVSRRGTNPKPGDKNLDQVTWVKVRSHKDIVIKHLFRY